MDKQLVDPKLESLRRCVLRVETKLPENLEAFLKDIDAQDIIALKLTRAIHMCVDIAAHWLAENTEASAPKTMGQAFEALSKSGLISEDLANRMRLSVGFRNVMVHNYDEVNWQIVYSIGSKRIGDFRTFAQVFSTLLSR